MATFLFAWELGGGAGHCARLLPVIEALAARGHAVYFAACDLTTAQQMCRSPEVRCLPAPSQSATVRQIRLPRSFAHILHNIGFGDSKQLEAYTRAWRNVFELIRPDLIVCEHAPFALLASRGGPARRTVIGTGFTLPLECSPWPDLRPWLPMATDALADDEAALLACTNDVLRRIGVEPLERMAQLYTDVDASFLVAFRELDHCGARDSIDYLGSWGRLQESAPEWPDGAGPRIFAYVKSYGNVWRAEVLLSVLRDLGHPSLVYVGGGDPAQLQLYQTSRLRIVPNPVAVDQAASKAAVAVLNGTAGTTAQILRAGVPILQIPISLEQTMLSRRVGELGAGLLVDPQCPELIAVRLSVTVHGVRENCDSSPVNTQQIVC